MGKGSANAYPGWWATSSDNGVPKRDPIPDIYKSQQDKDREYWDEYYKDKGWSQRRREFEQDFKTRFMEGEFFEKKHNNFTQGEYQVNDIHPVFKIKKSSSEEDFKKQYKKLILEHHPDKSGGDSSMFIKIQEAWECIKRKFI